MDKIIENSKILGYIFQHLKTEDHLTLMRVCTQFHTVVVKLIFQNKFKVLEVYKGHQNSCTFSEYIGNALKMEEAKRFEIEGYQKHELHEDRFEKLVQAVSCNIEELVLFQTVTYYMRFIKKVGSLYCSPADYGFAFEKANKFPNLTSVWFKCIIISEKDVQNLVEKCTKIEKLGFEKCLNINKQTLIIGQDVQVNTLLKFNNLKSFEIKNSTHGSHLEPPIVQHYKYSIVLEMLINLNITKLSINVEMIYNLKDGEEYAGYGKEKEVPTNQCKELQLGIFPCQRTFDKFSILNSFKNLEKLTLTGKILIYDPIVVINREFFKTLTTTCTHLVYLKLNNFVIPQFEPIRSLKELILENCTGMSWGDFKMIISNMKLKSFTSLNTNYQGNFEYFIITPTLECFCASGCKVKNFKQLFELNNGYNLKNLTTLSWNSNLESIPTNIVTNCLKLQTLSFDRSIVSICNIRRLESLEELTLLQYGNQENFMLEDILKHPTLKHFAIINASKSFKCVNSQPAVDIKTNLEFINMPFIVFKLKTKFWLRLLSANPNLKLMFRYNPIDLDDYFYLKHFIYDSNFPKHLKSLQICGLNIEIKKLLEDITYTRCEIVMMLNNIDLYNQEGYTLL